MPALKDQKHEFFCLEFIKDLNATKAYIRAGYSPNGANTSACKLLAKTNITARIAELKAKRAGKLEVKTDDVLRQLKMWVDSDLTEFMVYEKAEIKKLPIELRRLITSFKMNKMTIDGITNETVELKFVSKEKAQDWINRHIGFYEKDNRGNETKTVGFNFTPVKIEDVE